MKERTVVHWLVKKLHLKLSGVVGLITSGWLGVHVLFLKPVVIQRMARSRLTSWACTPVELFSMQAVVAGFIISAAASDVLAKRTVSLLGKRQDGSIDPVRYAVFLPYHIGLTTKLRLERSKKGEIGEDPYNKISDGLYLGGWPAHEAMLPPKGLNGRLAVCDVTCELPKRVNSIDAYMVLPVWDSHAPTAAEIDLAVEWAISKLGEGYTVFVHCAHGHGRSAVITGGILRALDRAKTSKEAVEMMKIGRPLVKLNSRQLSALIEWEQQRFGIADAKKRL